MIVLACETSTLLGSVAVVENDRVLAVEESLRQGSHSDVLNVFVERALEKAEKNLSEVDLFASGIGPGSFTGIRISVNTVKSLAYCQQKPVIGMSSLYLLARQVYFSSSYAEFKNLPIVSMVNAYKNMVYVTTYMADSAGLVELKAPEVVRVQNLDSYVTEKSVFCGDGYKAYREYFTESLKQKVQRLSSHDEVYDTKMDEPHAATLAVAASQQSNKAHAWNQLLPLYLRASEAEENLKGIKYQPLI